MNVWPRRITRIAAWFFLVGGLFGIEKSGGLAMVAGALILVALAIEGRQKP